MNPTPNLWNAKWKFNDELQKGNGGTYPTDQILAHPSEKMSLNNPPISNLSLHT
jgi:hypothetical protein